MLHTPGPAVLLVVTFALRRGVRPSLGAASGIIATNTLYFGLSAAGVAALLLASREQLFIALKWVGAGYLAWLGVRLILAGGHAAPAASGEDVRRAFVRGLLVQGANPKAIGFFVALLPQFLDTGRPLAPQLAVLAASSVVIEFVALFSYAKDAAGAGRIAGRHVGRGLERAGGALLIGAGVRLAAARPE